MSARHGLADTSDLSFPQKQNLYLLLFYPQTRGFVKMRRPFFCRVLQISIALTQAARSAGRAFRPARFPRRANDLK